MRMDNTYLNYLSQNFVPREDSLITSSILPKRELTSHMGITNNVPYHDCHITVLNGYCLIRWGMHIKGDIF